MQSSVWPAEALLHKQGKQRQTLVESRAGTQVKVQESRYSADLTPSMSVTGSLQSLKAQKAAFSPPHFSHCVIYFSLRLLYYI